MSKTVTAVDTVHEAPQHSSSWRAIALCVDDYGLNDGVNQAVLALAQLGRVQAVSAMVGGPAWRQGAPALRALDGAAVEVGLHLDLTECALDPALRFPLSRLIARAYLGQLDRNALQREIAAQLDAFEHAMGRAPAYVDGHQHVHQLPQVRDALLEVLAMHYAPGERPWLRHTQPLATPSGGVGNRFKAWVIAALGSVPLQAMARRQGFPMSHALAGVYDCSGGVDAYQRLLRDWLVHAEAGDVLMCHPAVDAVPADPIATARVVEFHVLASDWMGELLSREHIRLAPLSPWLREHAALRAALDAPAAEPEESDIHTRI